MKTRCFFCRAPAIRAPGSSLQLHRPVSIIKELLPGAVALIGQPDIDNRRALRLVRLGDEMEMCLLGRAAAFLDVALHAAADDVLPGALAALRFGDDVVERELGCGHLLAAVLTAAAVAGVDIAAVE